MSHETVAENSKSLASKYANKGNFGRAFSHYLVALKLKPEWREDLHEEFSTVLCKWGSILDKEKRYQDLFMCYEQAVDVFPSDPVILNNLGAHLVRCGLLKEATHYFRKCLTINPYFLRAAHNFENISNLAIERWHFRMLNDQHRNEAFREAIIKKINQGFITVLDVGTGTGILSLFSWEGKAKEIYACDFSSIMIEVAENVCRGNNAHDIKLINKHSSELKIPDDIPERVSLLVTETFDAGLLGEGILETLSHAWKYLLRPAHPPPLSLPGVVIPFGASIYITGMEVDEFANDFHLKKLFLFENFNILRNCEHYDTQDLSRTRFKCLTKSEKALTINFNNPEELENILKGKVTEMTLKCSCLGRLDCFAVWFDLHLDEDIVLSTSPLSRSNVAWDQAIFPLPRSEQVEEEQEIKVTIVFDGKKLNVNFLGNRIKEPTFVVSEDVVNILNNKKLVDVICEVGDKLSVKMQTGASILDCCCFPVFGLNFLLQRRDKFEDRLTCCVPSEGDRLAVRFLAEKYGLEIDVILKTECCFEDYLKEKKFDLIFLDLVDTNGEIRDEILLLLEYFKSLLNPGGIILPEEIEVIGQFVYSDWLWKASEVIDNTVTCGYRIAEYINEFKVRHFIDLDLKSLEHKVCCEPFILFSLLHTSECILEKKVPRFHESAHANAMIYWFKFHLWENCRNILTKDDGSYHQAAILFSQTELSEIIKFNVIRSDGLFNIKFITSDN